MRAVGKVMLKSKANTWSSNIYSGLNIKKDSGNATVEMAIVITSYSIHYTKLYEICQIFNGIDPADEGPKGWAPVLPMQHYSMGGIRTKPTGETTRLAGLFACGEASCWDMHGFNRLGGNSVSETVVAGMIRNNFV